MNLSLKNYLEEVVKEDCLLMQIENLLEREQKRQDLGKKVYQELQKYSPEEVIKAAKCLYETYGFKVSRTKFWIKFFVENEKLISGKRIKIIT